MSKKDDKYSELSLSILNAVGGVDNISSVTHCMTRLRFNLKDASIPQDDKVKKIDGVLGVARAGGQYQVIIGQTVPDVYEALLSQTNGKLVQEAPIKENLDKNLKEPFSWKRLGNNILNKLAGSMTPLIPVLMVGGMFKMFATVSGPQMLKLLTTKSDLYQVFTIVGDVAFYFLPILIGYTAAKQFNTSKVLGMLMGGIMLDPTLVKVGSSKIPFSVYGIPMFKYNYGSTVIPIILTVWLMSYVYKFLNKHMIPTLRTIFSPTLTVLIMLPIELCAVGPLGAILGDYFCKGIMSFGKLGGLAAIIAVTFIGAFWEFLVLTGMHLVLITSMLIIFAQGGTDPIVSIGAVCATFAVWGMSLGVMLRAKDKKTKTTSFGFFVAGALGGVTEPALYGLGLTYKKPLIGLIIGGGCGALYGAITHVSAYIGGAPSNFLGVIAFTSPQISNLVNSIIAAVIALIVATIATYMIGFNEKKAA